MAPVFEESPEPALDGQTANLCAEVAGKEIMPRDGD